jgi:hypothetical protein
MIEYFSSGSFGNEGTRIELPSHSHNLTSFSTQYIHRRRRGGGGCQVRETSNEPRPPSGDVNLTPAPCLSASWTSKRFDTRAGRQKKIFFWSVRSRSTKYSEDLKPETLVNVLLASPGAGSQPSLRDDTESSVFRSGFGRHTEILSLARSSHAHHPLHQGHLDFGTASKTNTCPKLWTDWTLPCGTTGSSCRDGGTFLRRPELIPDPPTRQLSFFARSGHWRVSHDVKIRPFGSPPLAPLYPPRWE